jgi:4-amino-4-deoxy-L-arabinose transferase-like glycosyltransferase
MAWRIFWLMACVYLLTTGREPPWADSRVMWETAVALVDRRSLELTFDAPSFFFSFRDGKKFGLYPLGNVIALVPGYLLYKVLVLIPDAPAALLLKWVTRLPSTLVAAGACALFFRLARREGASPRAAAGLALALGLTTILAVYARVPCAEALQAFLLTWVVLMAFEIEERATIGRALQLGFAAGWLANAKAVYVLALGVVAIWLAVRLWPRRRDLVRVAIAAGGVSALWLGVMLANNYVKTGSPFDTGYSTAAGVFVFSGRFYDAVWGFLFSPGKSIFVHSPLTLLGVIAFRRYAHHSRAHALLVAGVVAAVFLPHTWFHSWYGGMMWGPRYMVSITPLLLLPAAPWIEGAVREGWFHVRRAAVGATAAAGLFVQIVGCLIYWDYYIRLVLFLRVPNQDEHWAYVSTVFAPPFAPIVGHAWLLWHFITGNKDLSSTVPWSLEIPRRVDLSREWGIPVDVWTGDWFGMNGSPRAAAALIGALLCGIAFCLWDLARALRKDAAPPAARTS